MKRNQHYSTSIQCPRLAGILLALTLAGSAMGQDATNQLLSDSDTFFGHWFARVNKIQAEQPHWITPMTTVTPRLEEELRYDQSVETTSSGTRLDNYGSGKGLELIPTQNVEVILGIPGWQTRNRGSEQDGFTDESFLFKYRLLSANEDNGNYILTGFLGLQVPTGSRDNTTGHYTVTPTLAGGKGWGDFDVQSTLGVAIPDDGAGRGSAGTPVLLNTAFQYRFIKVLWPEMEVNYTYWPDGIHEGRNQVFLTPGFLIGRLPIWQRVGLTIGLGYQIAMTGRPTYNHNFIVSARIPF